jgi:uncharacterized protein YjbI with pentapeptide repeats
VPGEAERTPRKGWLARGKAADRAVVASEQSGRRGSRRLLLSLVVLAALAGLALWQVPQLQVAAARERLAAEDQLLVGERLVLENDLFQAENAARATLALIFGAGGLLLGLGIVWRRFEISRELRTHERFARAVEQLGSERGDGSARTEARLGGIYALEQLLLESEREYWPVMEVLTAYVRENAAWKPDERAGSASAGPLIPPADIQAIMAVLGRSRKRQHAASAEKRLLDLRETDLRGANLSGSRLDGVTLHGAHLEKVDATRAILTRSNLREADLSGASLTEADMEGTSLSRANLEGARLNAANLKGADLSGANLRGADLWEANLKGCNLKDADLRGADLSQCILEEAILWRADLQDAVLAGTRLRATHLERANLAGATGLTWEQGEDAFTDENTILPDYLLPEQVRHTVAAVGRPLTPPAPTPAARRAPTPRAAPKPSQPARTAAAAAAPMSVEPKDNVVQLKPAAGRPRAVKAGPARKPSAPSAAESSSSTGTTTRPPKKAALPKHRRAGLVKPA